MDTHTLTTEQLIDKCLTKLNRANSGLSKIHTTRHLRIIELCTQQEPINYAQRLMLEHFLTNSKYVLDNTVYFLDSIIYPVRTRTKSHRLKPKKSKKAK